VGWFLFTPPLPHRGAGAAAPTPAARGAHDDASKPKPPREREVGGAYELLDNSVTRPITRALDLGLLARKLANNPREAANVDEQDQVRLPSTWWQPRIGFRDVPVERMLRGPGSGRGPVGRWTVTKAKSEGVSPGFQIEDSNGDDFIIKFDPPRWPEMASGADVIGSYLFWAAGYNVPDNVIATFAPESLLIDDEATYTEKGKKKKVTHEYLARLLTKAARRKDGRFRCVASRYLKGKPLGPFEYRGRRGDDPEDLIPHELRRELRGLWTVCAFANHADVRSPNTLDMWVEENGRSFVRHHLIDFGSILGSSATTRKAYVTGTEYYLDYGVMGTQVITLGLAPFAWEEVVDPKIPAVGFVESKVFDPEMWRPDYPNPAFDERTERDIRWGARIVAGFTDRHIAAAVAAAQYSDPRASDYLKRVLMERRDKLVRRWLGPGVGTGPAPAAAR
jgi:hypothetical protein